MELNGIDVGDLEAITKDGILKYVIDFSWDHYLSLAATLILKHPYSVQDYHYRYLLSVISYLLFVIHFSFGKLYSMAHDVHCHGVMVVALRLHTHNN